MNKQKQQIGSDVQEQGYQREQQKKDPIKKRQNLIKEELILRLQKYSQYFSQGIDKILNKNKKKLQNKNQLSAGSSDQEKNITQSKQQGQIKQEPQKKQNQSQIQQSNLAKNNSNKPQTGQNILSISDLYQTLNKVRIEQLDELKKHEFMIPSSNYSSELSTEQFQSQSQLQRQKSSQLTANLSKLLTHKSQLQKINSNQKNPKLSQRRTNQIPNIEFRSYKVIDRTVNYQIVELFCTFGYENLTQIQKKLYILNVYQISPFHLHSEIDHSGTMAHIYQIWTNNSCNGKNCIVKCIDIVEKTQNTTSFTVNDKENMPTKANAISIQSLNWAIKQYFIAYIMSSLQIGPKINKLTGFDCIIFKGCLEFSMEVCERHLYKGFQNDLKQNLLRMHSLNICHRDIKPANIMFSNSYKKLVFIDFGISDFMPKKICCKTLTQPVGTYQFASDQMKYIIATNKRKFIDLYLNDVHALYKSLQQIHNKRNYKKLSQQKQYSDKKEIITAERNFKYSVENFIKYIAKVKYENQFSSLFPAEQQIYDDQTFIFECQAKFVLYLFSQAYKSNVSHLEFDLTSIKYLIEYLPESLKTKLYQFGKNLNLNFKSLYCIFTKKIAINKVQADIKIQKYWLQLYEKIQKCSNYKNNEDKEAQNQKKKQNVWSRLKQSQVIKILSNKERIKSQFFQNKQLPKFSKQNLQDSILFYISYVIDCITFWQNKVLFTTESKKLIAKTFLSIDLLFMESEQNEEFFKHIIDQNQTHQYNQTYKDLALANGKILIICLKLLKKQNEQRARESETQFLLKYMFLVLKNSIFIGLNYFLFIKKYLFGCFKLLVNSQIVKDYFSIITKQCLQVGMIIQNRYVLIKRQGPFQGKQHILSMDSFFNYFLFDNFIKANFTEQTDQRIKERLKFIQKMWIFFSIENTLYYFSTQRRIGQFKFIFKKLEQQYLKLPKYERYKRLKEYHKMLQIVRDYSLILYIQCNNSFERHISYQSNHLDKLQLNYFIFSQPLHARILTKLQTQLQQNYFGFQKFKIIIDLEQLNNFFFMIVKILTISLKSEANQIKFTKQIVGLANNSVFIQYPNQRVYQHVFQSFYFKNQYSLFQFIIFFNQIHDFRSLLQKQIHEIHNQQEIMRHQEEIIQEQEEIILKHQYLKKTKQAKALKKKLVFKYLSLILNQKNWILCMQRKIKLEDQLNWLKYKDRFKQISAITIEQNKQVKIGKELLERETHPEITKKSQRIQQIKRQFIKSVVENKFTLTFYSDVRMRIAELTYLLDINLDNNQILSVVRQISISFKQINSIQKEAASSKNSLFLIDQKQLQIYEIGLHKLLYLIPNISILNLFWDTLNQKYIDIPGRWFYQLIYHSIIMGDKHKLIESLINYFFNQNFSEQIFSLILQIIGDLFQQDEFFNKKQLLELMLKRFQSKASTLKQSLNQQKRALLFFSMMLSIVGTTFLLKSSRWHKNKIQICSQLLLASNQKFVLLQDVKQIYHLNCCIYSYYQTKKQKKFSFTNLKNLIRHLLPSSVFYRCQIKFFIKKYLQYRQISKSQPKLIQNTNIQRYQPFLLKLSKKKLIYLGNRLCKQAQQNKFEYSIAQLIEELKFQKSNAIKLIKMYKFILKYVSCKIILQSQNWVKFHYLRFQHKIYCKKIIQHQVALKFRVQNSQNINDQMILLYLKLISQNSDQQTKQQCEKSEKMPETALIFEKNQLLKENNKIFIQNKLKQLIQKQRKSEKFGVQQEKHRVISDIFRSILQNQSPKYGNLKKIKKGQNQHQNKEDHKCHKNILENEQSPSKQIFSTIFQNQCSKNQQQQLMFQHNNVRYRRWWQLGTNSNQSLQKQLRMLRYWKNELQPYLYNDTLSTKL